MTDHTSTSTTDTIPQRWLRELAATAPAIDEMNRDVDHELSLRALAARDDPAARDALLARLAPRVDRAASRYRRWSLAPWEYADVEQEAWLAFAEVLAGWRPLDGPDGPAGFGWYVIEVLPRRLATRVAALLGHADPRRSQPVAFPPGWEAADPADPLDVAAANADVIRRICARLNSVDATMIAAVASDDVTLGDAAARAGVSRRALYRHRPRIVAIVRAELGRVIPLHPRGGRRGAA